MKCLLLDFVGLDKIEGNMSDMYHKFKPLFREIEDRYIDYWRGQGKEIRIGSSAILGNMTGTTMNFKDTKLIKSLYETFDNNFRPNIDDCPDDIFEELKGVWTAIALGIMVNDLGKKIEDVTEENQLSLHFVCTPRLARFMQKENERQADSDVLDAFMGVIRGFLALYLDVEELSSDYEDMTIWTVSTGDQLLTSDLIRNMFEVVVDDVNDDDLKDLPKYLN